MQYITYMYIVGKYKIYYKL